MNRSTFRAVLLLCPTSHIHRLPLRGPSSCLESWVSWCLSILVAVFPYLTTKVADHAHRLQKPFLTPPSPPSAPVHPCQVCPVRWCPAPGAGTSPGLALVSTSWMTRRTGQNSNPWPWGSCSLAFPIYLTSPPTLGPRTEM